MGIALLACLDTLSQVKYAKSIAEVLGAVFATAPPLNNTRGRRSRQIVFAVVVLLFVVVMWSLTGCTADNLSRRHPGLVVEGNEHSCSAFEVAAEPAPTKRGRVLPVLRFEAPSPLAHTSNCFRRAQVARDAPCDGLILVRQAASTSATTECSPLGRKLLLTFHGQTVRAMF